MSLMDRLGKGCGPAGRRASVVVTGPSDLTSRPSKRGALLRHLGVRCRTVAPLPVCEKLRPRQKTVADPGTIAIGKRSVCRLRAIAPAVRHHVGCPGSPCSGSMAGSTVPRTRRVRAVSMHGHTHASCTYDRALVMQPTRLRARERLVREQELQQSMATRRSLNCRGATAFRANQANPSRLPGQRFAARVLLLRDAAVGSPPDPRAQNPASCA